MKHTYIFDILINIPEEANITLPSGVRVEPVAFGKVVLSKEDGAFTDNQVNGIKAKLTNLYNNKFGFTSTKVELNSVIK